MKYISTLLTLFALLFYVPAASAQQDISMDQMIQQNDESLMEQKYTYNNTEPPELEIVAELPFRPANIAISQDNRIFLTTHPVDNYKYAIVELLRDGTTIPYPNEDWSTKPDKQGKGMNGAIGISVTFEDEMFVLDVGSPEHQAKILSWDMKNEILADTYYIPNHVTTPQSFFQDISVDWTKRYFYVADMGQADLSKPARPAILTMGQLTGYTRRLLDSHPAFMPTETPVKVDGKELTLEDGKPIHAGLNPITLLPLRSWFYLAPMGEGMVYKIRTYHLLDEEMSDEQLAEKLVPVGEKPASDGMTIDAAGNIYMGDLEHNAVGVMDKDGNYSIYLQDDRLQWVDGFSFGADGYLYVTINQLHKSPLLNGGKEEGKPPYYVARFKPLAAGALSR
ncbi:MAG: hypothetical protein CL561_05520 [Alphaproteobacteria bacterium]|nr:hypothetical protein [Alphaproteobacteria bacterium]|tara:strand:- start:5080 stop:6261 length:1182 start_codon:yes stop_codon:yes gene_type:complete